LLGSGIFLWFGKKSGELTVGITRKQLLYLALFSALLLFVYALIFFANNVFDEGLQRSYSLSIANGNFPVRDPFNFSYSIQYHYGFNLLVAGVAVISGLSIIRSLDISLLVIILPVFWMVFALVYRLTKNYKMGFLSAWLFFFAGGLRYLTVFGHIQYSGVYFEDYLRQVANLFFSNIPNSGILGPGYFHPYSIDTYAVLLYHPPTAMVMPIILLVVWLLYERESFSGNKTILNIAIGVLIGLTALVSEDKFLVVVAALGIFALWKLFSQKVGSVKEFARRLLREYGFMFLIAIPLALFQGGVLTDMFFGMFKISKLNLVGSISTASALSLRYIPGIISTSGFYPFSKIYSWVFLITEWGIPILLFPFILFFVYKKKNETYYLLTLMIVLGFAVSFFINYSAWAAVFYRFACTGYMLLAILLGIFLVDWMGDKKWRKNTVCALVVLMAISPVMFNLKAIPVRPFLHQLPYNQKEIQMSDKVKSFTERNSVIVSEDPVIVAQLFGRFAYETDSKVWNYGSEPFIKHLSGLSVDDLKQRGIDYIYADPAFLQEFKDNFLKNNITSLEKIVDLDGQYILYKIK